MKNVVILLPSHWSAMMGGAEYQAKLLTQHLVDSGRFNITWLCRRFAADYRPEGYRIRQIAKHEGLRARGFFFDAVCLSRLLHEIKPEVIYQRVGCAYTGIAARYARRAGCRMVWHVACDADVTRSKWHIKDRIIPFRMLEKQFLEYGVRHVPDIVVQTRNQADLLTRHYGRTPTKLVRNFHPLSAESVDKTGALTVVWIANFKRVKQPEVFIRLAEILADRPEVRFVMVGAPSPNRAWMDELETRIARLNNLSFVGMQNQEQVNALLARSHLLINTSLYEGFSNTFIQAWVREVPVLSFNVDPDRLLSNEGLGLVAYGDYGMLRNGLCDLLSSQEKRIAIAKKAKAFALNHFSEANVGSLIDLLAG